jgi:hypothetical protein
MWIKLHRDGEMRMLKNRINGSLTPTTVYCPKQNGMFQQLHLYTSSAVEELGSKLHEMFKNVLHLLFWF